MNNWIIRDNSCKLYNELAKELGINEVLAQILVNRGISDNQQAHDFLYADYSSLSDPSKLKGVDEAAQRLKRAANRKEKVFIFGDYDVDGVTSSALLSSCLKRLGIEAKLYLPHRVEEGYGINEKAIEQAVAWKADVFVSVDCGVNAKDEVDVLNSKKIDTIVIDHHLPEIGKVPVCLAMINPKVTSPDSSLCELTAAGLVFKLIQRLDGLNAKNETDLVCLGTICDIAPLLRENRILVKEGLKLINQDTRPGIKALRLASGLKDKEISAGFVGFALGPRLNASGRIDTALKSFSLLLADDLEQAMPLAEELNVSNRKRQKIEERILQEAIELVKRDVNFKQHSIIVVGKQDWHPGVVGIVASKLAERFCRPALVLSLDNGVYRGSGRSIKDFHLLEALCECSGLLKEYGGHKAAAGVSVEEDNFEAFKSALNLVANQRLKPEHFIPSIYYDAKLTLKTWQDIQLIRSIEALAPFGMGNPRPLFLSRVFLKASPEAVGRNSLRLWISDGECTLKAIGFGLSHWKDVLKKESLLNIVYSISIDNWQEPAAQIEIKDIKVV